VRIQSARLSFLEIPFRMSVTHGARADRTFSDSLVLHLAAENASGYGEAVVRGYVSGPPGSGADLRGYAVRAGARIVTALQAAGPSWRDGLAALAALPCAASELPLLCAAETAVLDMACSLEGADIYDILGLQPRRQIVAYGGVMPILPTEQAKAFIRMFKGFAFPDFKVKVNSDSSYNTGILGLCRDALSASADIRVDANGCWEPAGMDGHLAVCERFGVRVVEQPFPVGAAGAEAAARQARERGFTFMADEGVLGAADVAAIAASGSYHSLNLRLSKNGGISRLLAMAGEADARGLSYQLGCMVGETGILSALGRAAACLLPAPLYLEGSYDEVLLTGNITKENVGFGPGGRAPILRGKGVGFAVDEQRLASLTAWSASCL
jgi:L-Ala-D/L-Glu epimerase